MVRKQVKPPIDVTDFHIDYKDDEETAEEEKLPAKEVHFQDKDYTEANKGDNRFPNITFTTATGEGTGAKEGFEAQTKYVV